MSPRTSLASAGLALLLIGCLTGYRVRIETSGLEPHEREQLVQSLEGKAKDGGFTNSISSNEPSDAPGRPFVSSFYKELHKGSSRLTTMAHVLYYAEDSRLLVIVGNPLRGARPEIRGEIDALGDAFMAEMSRVIGPERMSVTRERQ